MRPIVLILASVLASHAWAQQKTKPLLTITQHVGHSVITELSSTIKLNEYSSLKREWFVVRDDGAPVVIDDDGEVRVEFRSGERYASGEYQYHSWYRLAAKEPVTAVEVRFHVFDVFGNFIRTLSSTRLVDFGEVWNFDARWRIWSENEASEAFAAVVYVARVRTASGRVYEIDQSALIEQIRKVSKRITQEQLEPKRPGDPKS